MKQALKRVFLVAPPKDRFSASLTATVNQLTDQANLDVTIGAVLPSAVSITLTNQFHHVSGTAAIKTIVIPSDSVTGGGFTGGAIYLIPDAAWTTITGGNIGLGSTAVVGKVLIMVYDGSKFWPSY